MNRAEQIVNRLLEADPKDFALAHPSEEELKAFAQKMYDDEAYDEEQGVSEWPKSYRFNDEDFGDELIQCGRCTNGARLVAQRFLGQVYGYACEDNPEAEVGANCGGHDFAVIGDYIVDYWAHHFAGESDVAVLPVNSPEARKLYGPRSKWKLMYDYTRNDPRAYKDG